jgi:HlyD family secretion protein
VHIQEGDPVSITFDALPGLTIPGKVARIKAIGQTTPDGTNTTYTVIISPDQQDQRFHWNMSASVAFVPSK